MFCTILGLECEILCWNFRLNDCLIWRWSLWLTVCWTPSAPLSNFSSWTNIFPKAKSWIFQVFGLFLYPSGYLFLSGCSFWSILAGIYLLLLLFCSRPHHFIILFRTCYSHRYSSDFCRGESKGCSNSTILLIFNRLNLIKFQVFNLCAEPIGWRATWNAWY